jgi:hypothetical protein
MMALSLVRGSRISLEPQRKQGLAPGIGRVATTVAVSAFIRPPLVNLV